MQFSKHKQLSVSYKLTALQVLPAVARSTQEIYRQIASYCSKYCRTRKLLQIFVHSLWFSGRHHRENRQTGTLELGDQTTFNRSTIRQIRTKQSRQPPHTSKTWFVSVSLWIANRLTEDHWLSHNWSYDIEPQIWKSNRGHGRFIY